LRTQRKGWEGCKRKRPHLLSDHYRDKKRSGGRLEKGVRFAGYLGREELSVAPGRSSERDTITAQAGGSRGQKRGKKSRERKLIRRKEGRWRRGRLLEDVRERDSKPARAVEQEGQAEKSSLLCYWKGGEEQLNESKDDPWGGDLYGPPRPSAKKTNKNYPEHAGRCRMAKGKEKEFMNEERKLRACLDRQEWEKKGAGGKVTDSCIQGPVHQQCKKKEKRTK